MNDEIIIYVGSFGSGKTEIAINHYLKEAQKKNKVFIGDLDIVNLYFCSRELRENLKNYKEIKDYQIIKDNYLDYIYH